MRDAIVLCSLTVETGSYFKNESSELEVWFTPALLVLIGSELSLLLMTPVTVSSDLLLPIRQL